MAHDCQYTTKVVHKLQEAIRVHTFVLDFNYTDQVDLSDKK